MDEAAPRGPYRRRTLIVDKKLQLRYFALFATTGAVFTAQAGVVTFVIQRRLDVFRGLVAPDEIGLMVVGEGLIWWYVAAIVLIGCFAGILGILVTHRIAGPVFVVSRMMTALTKGHFPLVRNLRKDDDLQNLFASFINLLDSVRGRERAEVELLGKAMAMLRAVSPTETSGALEILSDLHSSKEKRLNRPPTTPEEIEDLSPV